MKSDDKTGDAINLAVKYHFGQIWGTYFYIVHLNRVAAQFVELFPELLEEDPRLLQVCYLHDILEDTDCKEELLRSRFDSDIVDMVLLLTDKEGANRRERHEKTYPDLALNYAASCVKICDRIVNVEMSRSCSIKIYKMYQNEHKDFLSYFNWDTPEYKNAIAVLEVWLNDRRT